MKNNQILGELLHFWFADIAHGLSPAGQSKLWYLSDQNTDMLITERYQALLLQAANGELTEWQDSPRGKLGLIILLDQMSRNIYRGTAQAFAFDHVALSVCLEGLEAGQDTALDVVERAFFYHPLEHAECVEHQQRSVAMFESMLETCGAVQRDFVENALGFAREHRDIIVRFGRFPHRNQVLGRASTAEEMAYLNSGAKRFGQ